MKHKEQERPSEWIEGVLEYISVCKKEHQEALDNVKAEEAKLQDFLHKIEFADDKNERNRLVTSLRNSRRVRRKNKDRAMELEYVVNWCRDPNNRKVLNGLTQLLGNQRKREEYLYGERQYHERTKCV